jgi:hypothetical protein
MRMRSPSARTRSARGRNGDHCSTPADYSILTPTGTVLVSVVFRRSRTIQMIDLAPLVGSRQLEHAVGGLTPANQASSPSVADYVATAAGQSVTIEVVADANTRQATSPLRRPAAASVVSPVTSTTGPH